MRRQSLNNAMEIDHVVEILPDGSWRDGPEGVYAPESLIGTGADGQVLADDEAEWVASIGREGWEVITFGYSCQHGYEGPVMNDAEFIGGGLEDDIRAQPGLYAAIEVRCLPYGDEDANEDPGPDWAGWAVVRKMTLPDMSEDKEET